MYKRGVELLHFSAFHLLQDHDDRRAVED